MMYVDVHEADELAYLLGQCVPVEVAQLNPERADVWWIDAMGRQVAFELKQNGELLGSLESVEEQLCREMQSVDYQGLGIYGVITPTEDGQCQTWKPAKGNTRILVKDMVYRHNYKGFRAWLARLQELGIVVIEVPDVQSMAISLVAQYENSLKAEQEHQTFKRLITTKLWIAELDTDKARLAKQLMSICAGWGEEYALAVADHFPDLATFLNSLESGPETEQKVMDIMLRTGKRRLGKAAVEKMKEAVGL